MAGSSGTVDFQTPDCIPEAVVVKSVTGLVSRGYTGEANLSFSLTDWEVGRVTRSGRWRTYGEGRIFGSSALRSEGESGQPAFV